MPCNALATQITARLWLGQSAFEILLLPSFCTFLVLILMVAADLRFSCSFCNGDLAKHSFVRKRAWWLTYFGGLLAQASPRYFSGFHRAVVVFSEASCSLLKRLHELSSSGVRQLPKNKTCFEVKGWLKWVKLHSCARFCFVLESSTDRWVFL